jgi:predicted ATPase
VVDHLLGRDAERGRLADLCDEVRTGNSRAVVLRGAAGIGKTALLDDLAANAAGFRVVRAAGAEFESDLPFAGLTTLTRPLLGHLEDLPPVQAAALDTATARGEAGAPNPDHRLRIAGRLRCPDP